MKKYIKILLIMCLCFATMFHAFPVSASYNNVARGTYMSSAKIFANIVDGNDVVGNPVVTCLAKVAEIDVDMYLQRAYGNTWQNVTSAYNINVKDTNELDEYAIIYNVSPGTYRVYIEVRVTGYDGLWDSVGVGTGGFVINT